MNSRILFPALALLALLAIGAGCTADPAAESATPAVRADAALTAPEALASYVPPAPPGWRLLARRRHPPRSRRTGCPSSR